jgi:hypothetical protein
MSFRGKNMKSGREKGGNVKEKKGRGKKMEERGQKKAKFHQHIPFLRGETQL